MIDYLPENHRDDVLKAWVKDPGNDWGEWVGILLRHSYAADNIIDELVSLLALIPTSSDEWDYSDNVNDLLDRVEEIRRKNV